MLGRAWNSGNFIWKMRTFFYRFCHFFLRVVDVCQHSTWHLTILWPELSLVMVQVKTWYWLESHSGDIWKTQTLIWNKMSNWARLRINQTQFFLFALLGSAMIVCSKKVSQTQIFLAQPSPSWAADLSIGFPIMLTMSGPRI